MTIHILDSQQWNYLITLSRMDGEWHHYDVGKAAGYRPNLSQMIAIVLAEKGLVKMFGETVSITLEGRAAVADRIESYTDPLDDRTYVGGYPDGVPMQMQSMYDKPSAEPVAEPVVVNEERKSWARRCAGHGWKAFCFLWKELIVKIIVIVIGGVLLFIATFYVIVWFRRHGIELKVK